MPLWAGHSAGGRSWLPPGVLLYLQRTPKPTATLATQSAMATQAMAFDSRGLAAAPAWLPPAPARVAPDTSVTLYATTLAKMLVCLYVSRL
jgi:hypothetical protein